MVLTTIVMSIFTFSWIKLSPLRLINQPQTYIIGRFQVKKWVTFGICLTSLTYRKKRYGRVESGHFIALNEWLSCSWSAHTIIFSRFHCCLIRAKKILQYIFVFVISFFLRHRNIFSAHSKKKKLGEHFLSKICIWNVF